MPWIMQTAVSWSWAGWRSSWPARLQLLHFKVLSWAVETLTGSMFFAKLTFFRHPLCKSHGMSLTTFCHSDPPLNMSIMKNWPVTSKQTHRLSRMFSFGGKNILWSIRASCEWPSTISWFLVRPVSNFHSCSMNTLLMLLVATLVDVEHVFSHGHLVLSHIWSRLSVQSTWALICLGSWSLGDMALDSDVLEVGMLADVAEDGEQELGERWDSIPV